MSCEPVAPCLHANARTAYVAAVGGKVRTCQDCGEVLWWKIGKGRRVYPRYTVRSGEGKPLEVQPFVTRGGMEFDD